MQVLLLLHRPVIQFAVRHLGNKFSDGLSESPCLVQWKMVQPQLHPIQSLDSLLSFDVDIHGLHNSSLVLYFACVCAAKTGVLDKTWQIILLNVSYNNGEDQILI